MIPATVTVAPAGSETNEKPLVRADHSMVTVAN